MMRQTTRRIALTLVLAAAAALGGLAATPGVRASVCCSECQSMYEQCNAECWFGGSGTMCLRLCREWFQQQCLPTCDPGC